MQKRHAIASSGEAMLASAGSPSGPAGGVDVDAGDVEQTGERPLTPSTAPGRPARISTVGELLNIPVAWLDCLLAMTHDLPLDRGEDELVQALTMSLERIVPDVRVAIRLAPEGPPVPVSAERRSLFGSEPPRSNERVRSARAFPELAFERSVALLGSSARGALHFASDKEPLDEGAPHVQLLERASVVVAQALARRRTEERALALDLELRDVRAQMVQAEKLASLGQLAAGMVHELNNPLTSIAAYTDFLPPPGDRPGRRRRRRRGAAAADRGVRQPHAAPDAEPRLVRPSLGRHPMAVELNVVIDRALAFCEHEVADVGVTVERSFDADIGLVRGLPEQLAQVFVNLVTNACHAMARPRAGESGAGHVERPAVLRIATSRGPSQPGEPPQVAVVVEDAGCGIQRDHLPLVFNPFFTTKLAGRGTGLGLSIVKNIVEAHAGTIRVESGASFGTRFTLVFPVEAGTNEPG